ncbi:hypothetical protein CG723_18150 [Streptomyces sp. CB01635]|uniref:hypothetical protein n=1 Tax=unclassified Streptomyces TaxID=2593676 RepID=UPI000C275FE8|nr:hypothetical protein [Streptomyces sp. CB01635]PJN10307.1 hypothetical protein CG723_18150 [Streptomyces sp. CB01635]
MNSSATVLPTPDRDADADFLLPLPDPEQRLDIVPPAPSLLTPRDRHRLSLNATLTTAGIPPHPDDMEAIDALSALDDTVALAVQRWLISRPAALLG